MTIGNITADTAITSLLDPDEVKSIASAGCNPAKKKLEKQSNIIDSSLNALSLYKENDYESLKSEALLKKKINNKAQNTLVKLEIEIYKKAKKERSFELYHLGNLVALEMVKIERDQGSGVWGQAPISQYNAYKLKLQNIKSDKYFDNSYNTSQWGV